MTCACGCGEETSVVRGRPNRFVHGHNARVQPPYPRKERVRDKKYYLTHSREHPRSYSRGRIFEHLLVAERALGRPIPKGCVIHHANGDGFDNRPANLVICQDQAYHMLLHSRQRALEAAGNPNARRCWICGEWDDPSNPDLTDRAPLSAYHKHCAAHRARQRKDHRAIARRLADEIEP